MPFLFTNVLFLSALAGLGIPIALHLLLKRKSQRLRFSTVRFFARQDEQASSKRKLRNLLLLLLRLLLFALLVFAFARPYLPFSTAAGNRQQRQLILVLDQSASLQATDSGGVRWARAQKSARDLLATLKSDDRAALVTCGTRAAIASGFAPPAVVLRKLADLTPGTGVGDLGEGLREAARLVTLGDPKLETSIAVISDLQRAGSQNLAAAPLPPNVDVKVVPVGDLATPNVAVVELNLEPANDTLPHATLANYGDEGLAALNTEFLVDAQPVVSRPILLGVGGTTNLDLTVPPLKPGWHDAELRLHPKDGFALDDSRFATFLVPEPIPVLLVEGRKGSRSFQGQTFFLGAALDPASGTTNPPSPRFALRKVGPEELSAALVPRTGIPRPEVVILPAQKQLPADTFPALLHFVKTGGGLLLFAGDEINPSRYNSDFADLSPVVLRAVESADPDSPWRIGEHDRESAFFSAFRKPNSGNLALPAFTRRFSVAPADKDKGMIWARFDDSIPLLVGGVTGSGRVLWANTSADTAWNEWPKHKTFVPWLHNAVQFLAARADAEPLRMGSDFAAGTDQEMELGPTARKAALRVRGPGGTETNLVADDTGRLDLNLTKPGLYSVRDAAGKELRRFAVNVPASESDLAALRSADFQQQVVRAPDTGPDTLAAGLFGPVRNQKEFWRVLLLAAFVLLFVETIFSNRSHA